MERSFRRTALTVLVAILVCNLEAWAGSVRLADEYHQVVVLGEERVRSLGSRLLWVADKRKEVEDTLRQYWATPCEEAMMFAEPAPHAGEVMLTVGCKRNGRIQVDRSIPVRRERVTQDVGLAAWNQFVERVLHWEVSGAPTGLDPQVEASIRGEERAYLNSFAPLLAIYRDDRWQVLPLRVWEVIDMPRLQRGRWQEAMIDLLGMDRMQLDARDEAARVDRGRRKEIEGLDKAIRAGDLDTFRQVLGGLEYLPRNSYPVYRKLMEAMAKGQEAMVIHALRSGTPVYLSRDAAGTSGAASRPALAEAVSDSSRCAKCSPSEQQDRALKIVARWLEIAEKAQDEGGSGGVDRPGARQELEAAVIKLIRH